ncbi:Sulfate ABC transporter, system permease protein CysW [Clostridium bornimense]|uniref:Sulfate ABC transporter, system permease protein CysW n=1 Tax=Clostridium bornimense TaxID=1216932 RepID=W6RZ60_9CLOT|nr:sulfate ABC transporter permease subunit CysW [Clostridium bornimense]CDM69906.1 Sulfate ABC transporter, system permease protein CysW [Clostridium bornimense]
MEKSKFVKWLLISVTVIFLFLMLIMPLVVVIIEALKKGLISYKDAITDEYTIQALILTLEATIAAVVINTVFGLFAAWTITKFHFRGKKLLTTLIDIPFAISPVIAGLIFILTFGRIGWAYDFLQAANIKIVFAVPGIILATIFVTFPFVAREIIPVLNAQGKDEEEAAALMGAKGFKIFTKITLPHIKWALLYGIILCTARAMGEFGAVSVLSGHLKGKTNTLPLHIECLYNEFNSNAAFAVSSILVILAIIILILRNIAEHKSKKYSKVSK